MSEAREKMEFGFDSITPSTSGRLHAPPLSRNHCVCLVASLPPALSLPLSAPPPLHPKKKPTPCSPYDAHHRIERLRGTPQVQRMSGAREKMEFDCNNTNIQGDVCITSFQTLNPHLAALVTASGLQGE